MVNGVHVLRRILEVVPGTDVVERVVLVVEALHFIELSRNLLAGGQAPPCAAHPRKVVLVAAKLMVGRIEEAQG